MLAGAGLFENMEEEIHFYFHWNPLSVFDNHGHNVVCTSRGTNIRGMETLPQYKHRAGLSWDPLEYRWDVAILLTYGNVFSQ